mmetsp:Transcript_152480/g.489049  ORF Transcript_152480/g.489049 Transcript_152480/m.489049 type:complete len:87 (-) Transcript_152480:140-400(-)
MDSNGDSKLSIEEMRSFARSFKDRQRWDLSVEAFHRLDMDASDGIELVEIDIYRAQANVLESEQIMRESQERRFNVADTTAMASWS